MAFKRVLILVAYGLLAAASLVGALNSGVSQAGQVIKVAFLGSQDDEDYDGALVFKDYVESQTNGEVEVRIYPSGQFCSKARECIEGLQSGILEVHMTTIGGLGNLYGPGQALDLPYVLRDDRVAECVFDGPLVEQLRRDVLEADLGLRLMVVSNTGGWRNFATVNKLVKGPEDLKGLKIRTTPAPIQQELMRQLGGNPTPVAWSELYTAMSTGVVEGTKNGVQDIVGARLHENIKYITLDGHAYMGALWWYSEPAWQRLSPEYRRVVYDGFQHLKNVTRALPIRRQIAAYETFREAGGTVYVPTAEEQQRFRTASAGLRSWFADNYGQTWLDVLDREVAACEARVGREFDAADR